MNKAEDLLVRALHQLEDGDSHTSAWADLKDDIGTYFDAVDRRLSVWWLHCTCGHLGLRHYNRVTDDELDHCQLCLECSGFVEVKT